VTSPLKKTIFLAATVAAAVAVTPPTAAAKEAPRSACWKVVIQDWYDGRITGAYPLQCYRNALKHLSPDLEGYSSARGDIARALQDRIERLRNPASAGPRDRGSGGDDAPGGTETDSAVGPGPGEGRDKNGSGPAQKAIKALGSDDATSIPVPLIILGSIALLLVAAGAATFLAKRAQARKISLPTPPAPPAPPQ
jgi:hypothetical protein